MNTLFYDSIASALSPAIAIWDNVPFPLNLILGICLFVIILEFLSYPFNRLREFSWDKYHYRFVRNVFYSFIVIAVLTTIQGWLHIALGNAGDQITDVICKYAYPVFVLVLAIYDFIQLLRNSK